MRTNKISGMTVFFYILFLILVIYLAVQGAYVFSVTQKLQEAGKLNGIGQLTGFTELLEEHLRTEPFHFQLSDYTYRWLLWGVFGWFLFVAGCENSRKNYIRGKEYGTAKWGTLSDIRGLFADSICAEELRKARQSRWPIGRWLARRRIYRKCRADGLAVQAYKLENLKIQEEIRKKTEGKRSRKDYQDKIRKIRSETQAEIVNAQRQAWKPAQLEADYRERVASIDQSIEYSERKKTELKKTAALEYKKALRDCFSYKKQAEKIRAKYKDADMLFTRTEKISFYNYALNQNTLVLGGSGSRKTRGFVMPNVLQAHSSYVITDPKGEILEKAGYFLKEIRGYKLHVLNLDQKEESDGYNPFVYIHPEREGYEERVLSLIETIIINTDGGEKKNSSDPFWDKAERMFLQALFFFTVAGFPKEEQNMNTVLELLGMLSLSEENDSRDSDLDLFADIFAERFGEDHIGVQQYREFRSKASGKTAMSIVMTAEVRLAPFRTKAVRRIFSHDSMKLDMVGEERTAVFVVVPPTDTTFNFIAGMLFTQLFQELQYCAAQVHKHDGQRLPVPCRFILDEFANTCTIPNFVKILSYARSFGIGIALILQSLDQIKNMYKDEWGVIVDNCNTLLYLGQIQHMDTLEYMAKLLGKGTFDKRTTGRTRGKNGSSSENQDVIGRELMDASEIRKLPPDECLFIVGGRNPFHSRKYEYQEHPNYRFTSDANIVYSYHYRPETGPADPAGEPGMDTAVSAVPPVAAGEERNSGRISLTDQLQHLTEGTVEPIPDRFFRVDDGEPEDALYRT